MAPDLHPLAELHPHEVVSASALLPGFRTPSPSDLYRVLERIAAGATLVEAARAERCKPSHVRRIARSDPEVFGRYLTVALAGSGRNSRPRRRRSDDGRLVA